MPRRGTVPKRDVLPDPVYNSKLVSSFINVIMLDGKRALAESIMYQALERIKEKTGKDPLDVLDQAMENVMPVLEVRPRRVGGATYQVPIEVRSERRVALAIRWLVNYARDRSEYTMVDRLAAEILDAANNQGSSVKKREDTHRMAEANKAFAHYRW
ncbi:MAG: 30S ribosomal protein S7 [Firmicutes bacterium]|jgi:small subunit ribosomal protein S7|nr:30S ribosomal protein S7 [Bacillota bacterium]NLL89188.1 30S ribosomal protein S7 [Bacillota bacterium]